MSWLRFFVIKFRLKQLKKSQTDFEKSEVSSGVSLGQFLSWLVFSEPEVRVRKFGRALQKGKQLSPVVTSETTLLAIVLSLEEMARFREIAFRCCDFSSLSEPLELFGKAMKTVFPGFDKWAKEEGLSQSKKNWIVLSSIILSEIVKVQTGDPRLTLLHDVRYEFGGLKPENQIVEARSIFRRKLLERRSELPASFLSSAVILVEGPTEQYLMPGFAAAVGRGLDAEGWHLIASGGSNQVLKRYLHWKELVSVPIACLLDSDAERAITVVGESLRECDLLTVFENGEIEDAFDLTVFVELLNAYLRSMDGENCPSLIGSRLIGKDDFKGETRRRDALKRLWKKSGLGDFDKVDFARFVSDRLRDPLNGPSKVPPEISEMMHSLVDRSKGHA